MPNNDDLVLIRQSIEALKRRTLNDLDALAAQVDLLLPNEIGERGKLFRRYTREDWGKFIDGNLGASVPKDAKDGMGVPRDCGNNRDE